MLRAAIRKGIPKGTLIRVQTDASGTLTTALRIKIPVHPKAKAPSIAKTEPLIYKTDLIDYCHQEINIFLKHKIRD
jgi:hypothetical protein